MMEKSLFLRLLKNAKSGMAGVACVFLIALLMSACAGVKKEQMPAKADVTNQTTETGETDVVAVNADDQEIVCRMKATTGTRFKRRICATKAQWARLEEKNQADTDEFKREVGKRDSIAPDMGGDAMGGQSIGVPR